MKLIASIFMLIDHWGLIFYPEQVIYRLIGRLAMPIFAQCIVRGHERSSDLNLYKIRIFICAIVSQIPYTVLVNNPRKLNICFLWLLSLYLLEILEKQKREYADYMISSVIILFIHMSDIDYGIYGVIWIVILFRASKSRTKSLFLESTIFHAIYFLVNPEHTAVQIFSILSVPIINKNPEIKLSKKANRQLYWFYPVHMTILLIIRIIHQ